LVNITIARSCNVPSNSRLLQQPHAFLVLPTTEESESRIFHPLYVLARQGRSWTVAIVDDDCEMHLASGDEVRVYFDCNHCFMTQSARVVRLHANEDGDDRGGHEFELEVADEPTVAENRSDQRVQTTTAGLWMQLESTERCLIVDVGAKGCAIQTARMMDVGEVVEGTITRDGREYTGRFCVRSSQMLSAGVFRYGLRCEDVGEDEGENEHANTSTHLIKMLDRISADLARQQRRRLFGAA